MTAFRLSQLYQPDFNLNTLSYNHILESITGLLKYLRIKHTHCALHILTLKNHMA
jgi:hypothetical protein